LWSGNLKGSNPSKT